MKSAALHHNGVMLSEASLATSRQHTVRHSHGVSLERQRRRHESSIRNSMPLITGVAGLYGTIEWKLLSSFEPGLPSAAPDSLRHIRWIARRLILSHVTASVASVGHWCIENFKKPGVWWSVYCMALLKLWYASAHTWSLSCPHQHHLHFHARTRTLCTRCSTGGDSDVLCVPCQLLVPLSEKKHTFSTSSHVCDRTLSAGP